MGRNGRKMQKEREIECQNICQKDCDIEGQAEKMPDRLS